MDTQLYKWKEENQQINKQDDDNNIIIQDQGMPLIRKEPE